MSVILYSTNCPQCVVLKNILNDHSVHYEEINDVNLMRAKGMVSVPQLEVDGKIMNMKDALKWLKEVNE